MDYGGGSVVYDESDREDKGDVLGDRKEERINGKVYMMATASFSHMVVARNIYLAVSKGLDKDLCFPSMENFGFKYHSEEANEDLRGDFVVPDIMIMCNKDMIKKDAYYAVPKFIVEVISPSTTNRDRITKMSIYEEAGVSEYWIVNPSGSLEIYYLEDGREKLVNSYIYCGDKDMKDYNAPTKITLREFLQVSMTLGEVFAPFPAV